MSTTPKAITEFEPFRIFRVEFINNEDGKFEAFEVNASDFISDRSILKSLLEFLEEQVDEKAKTTTKAFGAFSKTIRIECYQSKSPIECEIKGERFDRILIQAIEVFDHIYSSMLPVKPMSWHSQSVGSSAKH